VDGDWSDRRILAFATHGLKPGDLPGLSRPALAMAALPETAQDTDGINGSSSPLLSLDDILGLKLNADWVILSACNSASDDGSAEEALSGLARGFFYAGSKAVLVTHWAVESKSAQELATRTMQYYARENMGRAESLRQAQLDLIAGKSAAQFQHPFYWSAYATSGDSGR
jgi:CHAT domain-containing protein